MLGGGAAAAPRGALGANALRSGTARTANDVFADIFEKYPDVNLDIYGSPDRGFTIGRIEVPEGSRNQGIGTQVMTDIANRADEIGAQINLTPSDAFGGSTSRLRDFYKGLGFVDNKGRNKDFSTRETMYRAPELSANRDATTGAVTLPAARNEAERMARDILELRAAGRASEVTDEMMAQADPQYMFDNTPLPMDYESRMSRAQDMGFGEDQYHGSSADFAAFDPLARDATNQKVMTHGEGVYLADSPRMANRYAERRDGGIVYPVRDNMANPWTTQNSVANLSPEDRATYMAAESGPEALGYSGRRLDRGVSVVPDPTNVRSRFARFDPEFAHLANLSAANASPGVGLLQMYQQQQLEERARRRGLLP
jgi:GNAT superfamily N-acetyltransferase